MARVKCKNHDSLVCGFTSFQVQRPRLALAAEIRRKKTTVYLRCAAARDLCQARGLIDYNSASASSTLLADRRRQSERPCGRSTPPSRSITAYRRAPRRRPRTRGPTPSPCWAYAVSCSGPSSIRCRRQCACHRGAPTPSRSSSRRRGSPGSRTEVVFRFSCGAYLREGKDSGSQWTEES